jgi:hypothetical protein
MELAVSVCRQAQSCQQSVARVIWKVLKRVEGMSVAGDQLSAPILDDDERAESVVLQFENPLRMVERQGSAGKRHGLECHRREDSKLVGEMGEAKMPHLSQRRGNMGP